MGLFSEVPDNIAVLNMRQDGSILIINFNKGFLAYGGGSSRIQAAIAQIVYTMTEISPIRQVKFLIEGSGDELVIGGEGYVIDRPLSRQDINI
jgi:spore germination protein GerM